MVGTYDEATAELGLFGAGFVKAEPRANLSSVTVRRTLDGKVKEWVVDLRHEQPNVSIKSLPARLADSGAVLIPLLPFDDPAALKIRRAGIFWAAPDRVFGQKLFDRSEKDDAPRTLGILLRRLILIAR